MAEPLKIDSEIASGFRVFRLTGPLTMADLFEFQDTARSDSEHPILIDLTGVPYMDSAGLGAILGILASCQRTGRKFGITGATERIQTLFKVSHVDGLIPSFDSLEAAASEIAKSATA
jgi:anti-sigma B factor antagonist